jgi:hypothetical protein
VRPNQSAELDPKHVITNSFSLKRPWLSQHGRLRLAYMLTRARRNFSGCTGPPEAVPSLLIIPLSSHVYPVLCTGATRCATTVSRPMCTATSRPTSATAHDAAHGVRGRIRHYSLSIHSSINSLVTGIWRDVTDRVSGSMPYTACHAASRRRTIAPHLRLPYSVRPIRLILSYFLTKGF